jgi:uncharacterized protein YycO
MDVTELPLPGTIGLVPVAGEVGRLIRLGQWLAEEPVWRWWVFDPTLPDYQHSVVYLGDGKIIEAEPGGARVMPVTEYPEVYWCTAIAGMFTEEQLAGVADMAHTFEGVKYSFLDYLALATHRLHIPAPGLKRYIASTGHMICSQLCDAAYRLKGFTILPGNPWPGYVMPVDFYLRDIAIRRGP